MDMTKIPETTSLKQYIFDTGHTKGDYDDHPIDLSCVVAEATEERPEIRMKWSIMSAAMQAVTGPKMAIRQDQLGHLGAIFASQPIEDEADMVGEVKRARAGFATQLEVLSPNDIVENARALTERTGYTVIPIVEGNSRDYGRLEGIIFDRISSDIPGNTKLRDIMMQFRMAKLGRSISALMHNGTLTPTELIRRVREYIPYCGTNASLEKAKQVLLDETSLKAIPIVTGSGELVSMVFRKDVLTLEDYPNSLVDKDGKYIALAAVNTHDYTDRVPALVEAGVDMLLVDASDGYSDYVADTIRYIKLHYPDIPVIGGNIINEGGFHLQADAGVDIVKVGMGIGSICTTQEQKRVGMGQPEAINAVAEARDAFLKSDGRYINLFADGSIVTAGDMLVAMYFGADGVMVGGFVAGCDETPNPVRELDGKRIKEYWGEGSQRAKSWRQIRYGKTQFEEGVEGTVPYSGSLRSVMEDVYDKWGATLKSLGAHTIEELREAKVVRRNSFAQEDGKPHNITLSGLSR